MLKDSFISALKQTGLHRLRYLLKNKYQMELNYQKSWIDIFSANPKRVQDYWINHLYLSEIVEMCRISESTKILGVGCSPSTVLQFIDGDKFAVDPLADDYMKFHSYDGIKLRKAYGEYLPYKNEFFDVVFCTNTLDHTSSPSRVASEICRVLKSGGYVVVVVEVFESHVRRDVGHPQCFVVDDVLKLFSDFSVTLKRISVWNPHEYYPEASDVRKKDLIFVARKNS
jgi:SAM-dependent methyltransferase